MWCFFLSNKETKKTQEQTFCIWPYWQSMNNHTQRHLNLGRVQFQGIVLNNSLSMATSVWFSQSSPVLSHGKITIIMRMCSWHLINILQPLIIAVVVAVNLCGNKDGWQKPLIRQYENISYLKDYYNEALKHVITQHPLFFQWFLA